MAWGGRLLPLWPGGFSGRNMAAQPGKSSPRRKSSNDEKRPGYPLQRQGCEFESLSPTQPDPVLVTYCTEKCRKPNKKLFKKKQCMPTSVRWMGQCCWAGLHQVAPPGGQPLLGGGPAEVWGGRWLPGGTQDTQVRRRSNTKFTIAWKGL